LNIHFLASFPARTECKKRTGRAVGGCFLFFCFSMYYLVFEELFPRQGFLDGGLGAGFFYYV